MKFSENRPKGSGDMAQTQFKDRLTDEGHYYKPPSASWLGIYNSKSINAKVWLFHSAHSFLKKRNRHLPTCNELWRLVTVSYVNFFLVKLIFYKYINFTCSSSGL